MLTKAKVIELRAALLLGLLIVAIFYGVGSYVLPREVSAGQNVSRNISRTNDFSRILNTSIGFFDSGDQKSLVAPKYNVRPKQSYSWTILIYLDADNNLESAGIEDFLEMARIGSTADVAIVVLFDRNSGYDTSYGDWSTAKLFYVEQGMEPNSTNALDDWGEVNMGDPQTLVNFTIWGIQNYPADHYALIVWDHGGGLSGVAWDEDNGDDNLVLGEIRSALSTIVGYLGRPLDIVGFDACLVGMGEVAYALRDHADIVVFSQETEPGDGWPYDDFLSVLVANPTMAPSDLASLIVEKYIASYNGGSQGYDSSVTLSAVNVSAFVEEFAPALDSLVGRLLRDYSLYSLDVDYAISNAESFYFSYSKDAKHFLELLRDRITDSEILSLIDDALVAHNDTVIAYGHLSGHPNANGFSLCMSYSAYLDTGVDFVFYHQWDDFIGMHDGYTPEFWLYDAYLLGSDVDGDRAIENGVLLLDIDANATYNASLRVYAKQEGGNESLIYSGNLEISGASPDDAVNIWVGSLIGIYNFRLEVYVGSTIVFQLGYFFDPDIVNVHLESLPGYPRVYIVSPTPGSEISGVVRLLVNATDEDGVSRVAVKVGSTWENMSYNATSGLWELPIDTRPMSEGELELVINATDGINTTSIAPRYIVDNYELSIISPTSGSIVRGLVRLEAKFIPHTTSITPISVVASFSNSSGIQDTLVLIYNSTSDSYVRDYDSSRLADGVYIVNFTVVTNMSTYESVNIIVRVDNYVAPILLVDDDAGDGFEVYYIEALEALGYIINKDFEVWDVHNNGSVTTDLLTGRSLVIWFTGNAYTATLTSSDEAVLANYLDSGGALLISGQDIGYDIGNDSFYINYLRAFYIADDSGINSVFGVDVPFSGTNYLLYGSDSANNNDWPDVIKPTNGSWAVLNYSSNYTAAIAYAGVYRLIYLAFPFEAINSSAARADCLERAILWLMGKKAGVHILSPSEGALLNTTNIVLEWTIDNITVDHYEVYVDGFRVVDNIPENSTSTAVSVGGDGIHTIKLVAVCQNGSLYYDEVTVTVDTTAPTVYIYYPIDNTNTTMTNITIFWYGNDAHGIQYYLVSIDGSTPINVGLNTSITISLSEGHHQITVYAVDNAGNIGEDTIRITVDMTPPTIDIVEPTDGATLNSTFSVVWNATDNISGVGLVEVYLDGSLVAIYTSANMSDYYVFHNVSNGEHTVLVKVFDYAGNSANDSVLVTVFSPVVIVILEPQDGLITNATEILVSWTYASEYSISEFKVYVDDVFVASVGPTQTSYLLSLSEGRHKISVVGIDSDGSAGIDYVYVIVDITAPTLTILSPINGTAIASDSVVVAWYGFDAYGIAGYWVRVDGGDWVFVGMNTSISIDLGEGMHIVYVKAVDRAGNVRIESSVFYVDLNPPEISIVSPSDGSIVFVNFTLSWVANDSVTYVSAIEIYVDGSLVARLFRGVNLTDWINMSVDEGYHTVTVRAYDLVGNSNNGSVGIRAVYVLLELYYPYNGTAYNTRNITIYWDAYGRPESIEFYIDGIFYGTADPDSGSAIISGISEGEHTLLVVLRGVGHTDNATVFFVVDLHPPEIHVTMVHVFNNSGVYVTCHYFTIVVNASDNVGVLWVDLYLNNTLYQSQFGSSLEATINLDSLGITSGVIVITISVTDLANNVVNRTWVIMIDNEAPTINAWINANYYNGTYYANTTNVDILWSVQDYTSTNATIVVSNTTWSATYDTSYDIENVTIRVGPGIYSVVVIVRDYFGHETYENLSLIVDTTKPSAELDIEQISASEIEISWSARDNNLLLLVKLRIDDKEVILAYNTTSREDTYKVSLEPGKHSVVLIVIDVAGNKVVVEKYVEIMSTQSTIFVVVMVVTAVIILAVVFYLKHRRELNQTP